MGVIIEGGICRKPGPSFNGTEGLEEKGKMLEPIVSPGRTSNWVAMASDLGF